MENIKVKKFNIGDRANGFNKNDTEAILEVSICDCANKFTISKSNFFSIVQKMAKFHALPIAMRLLKPEIFDEKIRPFLQRINLYEGVDKNGEICQVSMHVLCVL